MQLPDDWYVVGMNRTKRREHKSHGVISFRELSTTLSDRWKTADDEVKAFCKKVAARELEKYRKEQEEFKQKYGSDAFEAQKKVYKKRSLPENGEDVSSGKRGCVNDDGEKSVAKSDTDVETEALEQLHRDAMLQNCINMHNQQILLNQAAARYMSSIPGSMLRGTTYASFPSVGVTTSNTGVSEVAGVFPFSNTTMQSTSIENGQAGCPSGAALALSSTSERNDLQELFPLASSSSAPDTFGIYQPTELFLSRTSGSSRLPRGILSTSGFASSQRKSAFAAAGNSSITSTSSERVQNNLPTSTFEQYNPMLEASSLYPSYSSTSFTPTTNRTSAATSLTELLREASSPTDLLRGNTAGSMNALSTTDLHLDAGTLTELSGENTGKSRNSSADSLPIGREVANAFDSDDDLFQY